jgi:hypothetical protein
MIRDIGLERPGSTNSDESYKRKLFREGVKQLTSELRSAGIVVGR